MKISLNNISKNFNNFTALSDVSFEILPGRIHALLGANGSGKSTLVKILTGIYTMDKGDISINGNIIKAINSPAEAKKLGIRVVHQEAPLIDTLEVHECITMFKGYNTKLFKKIDWKKSILEAQKLFEKLDLSIDVRSLTRKLSAAERAMVSLAIALDHDGTETNLLILDEADASIPEKESAYFLEKVKRLANSGIPILMVTHRLNQVSEMADDVTILSHGKLVYSGEAKNIDNEFIINQMIGSSEPLSTATDVAVDNGNAPIVLEVEKIATEMLKDISFNIKKGEIVGITGQLDSGIADIPKVLIGEIQRIQGEIKIDGENFPNKLSPSLAISKGITLLPRDRLREGGVASLPLKENVILPSLKRYWKNRKLTSSTIKEIIEKLDVRPKDENAIFGNLSGGNQQKVILGKWLNLNPRLLILDDPTSGVDPAAREKMFEVIKKNSTMGTSFILITTEPNQYITYCSRVYILKNGKVTAELSKEKGDLTLNNLMRWSYYEHESGA